MENTYWRSKKAQKIIRRKLNDFNLAALFVVWKKNYAPTAELLLGATSFPCSSLKVDSNLSSKPLPIPSRSHSPPPFGPTSCVCCKVGCWALGLALALAAAAAADNKTPPRFSSSNTLVRVPKTSETGERLRVDWRELVRVRRGERTVTSTWCGGSAAPEVTLLRGNEDMGVELRRSLYEMNDRRLLAVLFAFKALGDGGRG